MIRDLSAVFSFAVRRGIASDNPVARASVRKTGNHRERYLSLEEVKRLGTAFNEVEAAGANAKGVAIGRLWALTGCRRDEIAGLKWSEVDFERGLLILDDSKTGRSVRPLGTAALALLESISRVPGTDYVFPAEVGDSYYQGMKRLLGKSRQEGRATGGNAAYVAAHDRIDRRLRGRGNRAHRCDSRTRKLKIDRDLRARPA